MSTSDIPLWSDNPAALDLLGFRDIAIPVLEAVGRDKLDPVAVGVFGPWGSGKTTILRIISDELTEDRHVLVVETHPWEYESFADVRATLIGEVIGAMHARAETEKDLGEKLKKRFADLVGRIRWSKAISLAASSALTFNVAGLAKITEIFGPEDAPEPSLAGFRDEFAQLMVEFDQITRVVVIVDDLDRCLPPAVVATLEAIKLFLSVPKMAFVLAADEESVVHAISDRYRPSELAATMAREYVEKIVQIPVRVPSLGLADTEAYLALMLLEHQSLGDESLSDIVAHCDTRRAAGEPTILDELGDLVPDGAASELQLARMLAPVLYADLKGNPRRLKRFLNAYWIRSAVASRRSVVLEPAALAKLMVLEELQPESFRKLVEWSSQDELVDRLGPLESLARSEKVEDKDAKESAMQESPRFRAWAALDPPLAGIELGPYLRLAASLMSIPTAGPGLRPDLRKALDDLISQSAAARKDAQERSAALPVDDRIELARHVTATLLMQPGRQSELGESIARLANGEESVAEEAAARLRGLDTKAIEPALCIRLLSGDAARPFLDLVSQWAQDDSVPGDTRTAAQKALQKGPKG